MQQANDRSHRIATIPNLMSLFRLLLIPALIWLYCVKKNDAATTAVLVLSGLTDVADGFIARRFNMVSELGKALDPAADKLTQAAMLYCLLSRFCGFWLLLALLVVKESINAVTQLIVARKAGHVLGAEWHGKLSTVMLYAIMILHLVWGSIPGPVSDICIGACAAIMVLSLVLYSIRNVRILRSTGGTDQKQP